MDISYNYINKKEVKNGIIVRFDKVSIPNNFLDVILHRSEKVEEFDVFVPVMEVIIRVNLISQMYCYPSGKNIDISTWNILKNLMSYEGIN